MIVGAGVLGHGAGRRRTVFTALLLWLIAACGPELTEPASSNVSGTWFSADTVTELTDFRLELIQAADGSLSGSWAGREVPLNRACAEPLCAVSNVVTGSHTVFQLHIDLLGIGTFTGQLQEPGRFRGHIATSSVTFLRVPIIGNARSPRDSQ